MMKVESKKYSVNAGANGNPMTADLSHLEKMLDKLGYSCRPPLASLQNEMAGNVKIFPSVFKRSYFKITNRNIELIVYQDDPALDKFAREYEPVPFNQTIKA